MKPLAAQQSEIRRLRPTGDQRPVRWPARGGPTSPFLVAPHDGGRSSARLPLIKVTSCRVTAWPPPPRRSTRSPSCRRCSRERGCRRHLRQSTRSRPGARATNEPCLLAEATVGPTLSSRDGKRSNPEFPPADVALVPSGGERRDPTRPRRRDRAPPSRSMPHPRRGPGQEQSIRYQAFRWATATAASTTSLREPEKTSHAVPPTPKSAPLTDLIASVQDPGLA